MLGFVALYGLVELLLFNRLVPLLKFLVGAVFGLAFHAEDVPIVLLIEAGSLEM